jgi:hypothetical protein
MLACLALSRQVRSRDADETSARRALFERARGFSTLVSPPANAACAEDPSGASYTAPLLSQPMILVAPCRFNSRMIAEPAAPTPEITN